MGSHCDSPRGLACNLSNDLAPSLCCMVKALRIDTFGSETILKQVVEAILSLRVINNSQRFGTHDGVLVGVNGLQGVISPC